MLALAGVAQWTEHRLQTSRQLDSQSGHRPGLQSRSSVGAT